MASNTMDAEVVTFTADIGQGVEVNDAKKKAQKLGVKEIFVQDLSEEFVKHYVFPMFRANAVYEGTYLLGTSIARPLIAKKQIEIAKIVGANYVAHGATGKGNDQIRFELGYYAINPKIKVIAPWREWNMKSRADLIDYAMKNQIPVPKSKIGEAPYSMDANLLHTSYEGKVLEDPWESPDESMFTRSVSCEKAPDKAMNIEIEFKKGDPVAINGKKLSPAKLLLKLNEIGGKTELGELILLRTGFIGMKSRGFTRHPAGR